MSSSDSAIDSRDGFPENVRWGENRMEIDELARLLEAEILSEYSDTVIDHAANPRNLGEMIDADGYARVTGPCGDTMKIFLRVREGTVEEASFWTDGCGTSLSCGSITTEMAKGKSIREVLGMTPQKILDALGGLPDDSVHCAVLAAKTLEQAVRDYFEYGGHEQWKRAYSRRAH